MSAVARSVIKPTPFDFEAHPVRIVLIDSEPWFVAVDVCEALGYGNPRQAMATHLDEDEKGVQILDTLRGKQQLTIISESGMYTLVLRSHKPAARKFAKWVTREVLPQIRKTGSYEPSKVSELPEPAIISTALMEHINRKAYAVALQQYETIRDIITQAVQGNLNCGATQEDAHTYIETYGDLSSNVTIINSRDIFMLARQTTDLLNTAGDALETINRLEKHLGRDLYPRKKVDRDGDYGRPKSFVETALESINA